MSTNNNMQYICSTSAYFCKNITYAKFSNDCILYYK